MSEPPQGLYYSERELWFHCEAAREALARLARIRSDERRFQHALEKIRIYLDGDSSVHRRLGQPCGADACTICLAEATASEALDPPGVFR